MASIELQQIHKWFDTLHVMEDLSIQKENCCFVGPSGCGKSTLPHNYSLRILPMEVF